MEPAHTKHPSKTLVLLPGFDGTGRLFGPLRRVLEPNFQTKVVSYPVDYPKSYDELCSQVERELPKTAYVIVAESFSGPIALMVAARKPQGLRALVLSATFATNPRPWLSVLLSRLLSPWCFRLPLPTWTIRTLMAGAEAPIELCRAIQAAVRIANPMVMAFRLREVMRSDATEALLKCSVPIFYLNGTRDRLLGKRALRSLSAARPDLTIINVPGPHMLLQAAPDTCARHIEAAVEDLNWHGR
jgi:pimeloyl-ACP methyl ester carboxylesterase